MPAPTEPTFVAIVRQAMVDAAKRAGVPDASFRVAMKTNARGELVLAIIFAPGARGWVR